MKNTLDEHNFIYINKAFAILSVISAHSSYIMEGYSVSNKIISSVISFFGVIGVGIFFMISGYLMGNNQRNFIGFFKKKLFSIAIPWLITGTFTYIYISIRKGGGSLSGWTNWIIGNGSYLYYLSVLIILYLVFFFFINNKIFLHIVNSISIGYILLDNLEIIGRLDFGISQQLNPMRWVTFFSIGILINKVGNLDDFCLFLNKHLIKFVILFVAYMALVLFYEQSISYYTPYYLPFAFLAIAVSFGISYRLLARKNKVLIYVGKESFLIYLFHMPVAGIVTNIFNRVDLWGLTLLRPFVVLAITAGGIYAFRIMLRDEKVCKLFSLLSKLN